MKRILHCFATILLNIYNKHFRVFFSLTVTGKPMSHKICKSEKDFHNKTRTNQVKFKDIFTVKQNYQHSKRWRVQKKCVRAEP